MSKVNWNDYPRGLTEKGKAQSKPLLTKASLGKSYHPCVILNHAPFPFTSFKFGEASSFIFPKEASLFSIHLVPQNSRCWVYFGKENIQNVCDL